MITYEEQLARDSRWALSEGSRHFEEKSAVQATLHRICKKLNDLGIPYAVVGGMALFQHGLRRFTEDVDILVTPESLKRIHDELEGLGYVRPFAKSKNLRETATGVRIEFLLTGDYPGDGKPKPLPFPDPADVSVEIDGIRYLNLKTLIELKLASGMTNVLRAKDIGDVIGLIEALKLGPEFGQQLNSYVRDRFVELATAAAENRRREDE